MTTVIGIEGRTGNIKITTPSFTIGVGISKNRPIWNSIRIRRRTKSLGGCSYGLDIRTHPDQEALIWMKILPLAPCDTHVTKQPADDEDIQQQNLNYQGSYPAYLFLLAGLAWGCGQCIIHIIQIIHRQVKSPEY